ncbi:MAG: FtsX-like permease family protein, partial [Acidimicrobiales bacterium]
LSPSAVAGVQFALRGRGGRAVPAAGMVAVGVIGVATLAAVLTFAASSTHLLDTPRLYGFNWDVTIGDGFGETDLRADAERTLAGDPRVAAYATGTIDGATVGDRSTALYVLDPVVGSLEPTMVEGRLPYGPGDAVVAAAVADRLGLELGDRFEVRRDPSEVFSGGRAGREQFEAVGIGLFPAIGGIVTNTLGEGVGLTAEGFGNLVGGEFPHDVVFIRAVEGRADELAADLAAEGVVPAAEPTELASYGRLSYLPGLIAGIVALVAGAALAHGVVTGVRDRRRDVALLRAVGFSRRQVGAVARWQALTVLALSTVVGVPLGVVGGRRGWAWFADVQHVLEEIVAPWPPLAVTVAGLAVLFLAVATLAARPAARLPLAAVLRSE